MSILSISIQRHHPVLGELVLSPQRIGGALLIIENAQLAELPFGEVDILGALTIRGNGALAAIAWPNVGAHGDLDISENPVMTTMAIVTAAEPRSVTMRDNEISPSSHSARNG